MGDPKDFTLGLGLAASNPDTLLPHLGYDFLAVDASRGQHCGKHIRRILLGKEFHAHGLDGCLGGL